MGFSISDEYLPAEASAPSARSLRVTRKTHRGPIFCRILSSKYTDAETGLLYYGYRYYQPETGRWCSRDPIGERGGRNVYASFENEPIKSIDLFGLYSEKECNSDWFDWLRANPEIKKRLDDVQLHGNCMLIGPTCKCCEGKERGGLVPLPDQVDKTGTTWRQGRIDLCYNNMVKPYSGTFAEELFHFFDYCKKGYPSDCNGLICGEMRAKYFAGKCTGPFDCWQESKHYLDVYPECKGTSSIESWWDLVVGKGCSLDDAKPPKSPVPMTSKSCSAAGCR